MLLPSCIYHGIDIGDYNNSESSKTLMDACHIVTDPEQFAEKIAGLEIEFDAVISSHNIEHCNKPEETLAAICAKIKRGGLLYLSFPQKKTVFFPSLPQTAQYLPSSGIHHPSHCSQKMTATPFWYSAVSAQSL